MSYTLLPWQQTFWTRLWSSVQRGRLPHALLFEGIEGIGKRYFADRLMQSLSCEQVSPEGMACGNCHGCRMVLAGSHPDCLTVVPESPAQAIRVDAVRNLTEFAGKTRLLGKYRVIVIDPASSMNLNAANALLKVLEEPPPGTVFVLVSHQGGVLPATIASRCQRWLFPLPDLQVANAWLKDQCQGVQTEAVLKATEGAPLRAREWLKTGLYELQQDFYRDWVKVRNGQLDVSGVAGKWSTKPLQEQVSLRMLLDWLFYWVRDLAGKQAAESRKGPGWLDFHAGLQQAVAWLVQVPQLNRQLMLEKVMLMGINLTD